MAVAKGRGFQIVLDYCTRANAQVNLVPWRMPDLKVMDIGDVAAHQCRFFAPDLNWCGSIYVEEGLVHDPESVHGLVEMKRLETGGELMKFLQMANSMTPPLPVLKAPLQSTLMNERLSGKRRRKNGAKPRTLMNEERTPRRVRSWEVIRRLRAELAKSCYPKSGRRVFMFSVYASAFLSVSV